MSPRTGRPKADNPKGINLTIRLDSETERLLRQYCEENKITKGEAIRRGIHLLLAQKKINTSCPRPKRQARVYCTR